MGLKLLVAGSRSIKNEPKVFGLINQVLNEIEPFYRATPLSHVISGGAKGVDIIGERWAKINDIEIIQIKPDWSKGKSAGLQRNSDLVDMCDVGLVVWDGRSRGSMDTVKKLVKSKKPFWVYTLPIFQPLEIQRNNDKLF